MLIAFLILDQDEGCVNFLNWIAKHPHFFSTEQNYNIQDLEPWFTFQEIRSYAYANVFPSRLPKPVLGRFEISVKKIGIK
jgi:hypothetical protein